MACNTHRCVCRQADTSVFSDSSCLCGCTIPHRDIFLGFLSSQKQSQIFKFKLMKFDKVGKSWFYFLLVFGFLFILFSPHLFVLALFVCSRERNRTELNNLNKLFSVEQHYLPSSLDSSASLWTSDLAGALSQVGSCTIGICREGRSRRAFPGRWYCFFH